MVRHFAPHYHAPAPPARVYTDYDYEDAGGYYYGAEDVGAPAPYSRRGPPPTPPYPQQRRYAPPPSPQRRAPPAMPYRPVRAGGGPPPSPSHAPIAHRPSFVEGEESSEIMVAEALRALSDAKHTMERLNVSGGSVTGSHPDERRIDQLHSSRGGGWVDDRGVESGQSWDEHGGSSGGGYRQMDEYGNIDDYGNEYGGVEDYGNEYGSEGYYVEGGAEDYARAEEEAYYSGGRVQHRPIPPPPSPMSHSPRGGAPPPMRRVPPPPSPRRDGPPPSPSSREHFGRAPPTPRSGPPPSPRRNVGPAASSAPRTPAAHYSAAYGAYGGVEVADHHNQQSQQQQQQATKERVANEAEERLITSIQSLRTTLKAEREIQKAKKAVAVSVAGRARAAAADAARKAAKAGPTSPRPEERGTKTAASAAAAVAAKEKAVSSLQTTAPYGEKAEEKVKNTVVDKTPNQAEVEMTEVAKQAAAKLDAAKKEVARKEAEQEAAKKEASEKEVVNDTAKNTEKESPKEAAKKESPKKETAEEESTKKEAAKKEAAKKEAAKKEAAKKEAAKKEAAKKEAAKKEAAKKEAAKKEAAKKEAAKQEVVKKETTQKAMELPQTDDADDIVTAKQVEEEAALIQALAAGYEQDEDVEEIVNVDKVALSRSLSHCYSNITDEGRKEDRYVIPGDSETLSPVASFTAPASVSVPDPSPSPILATSPSLERSSSVVGRTAEATLAQAKEQIQSKEMQKPKGAAASIRKAEEERSRFWFGCGSNTTIEEEEHVGKDPPASVQPEISVEDFDTESERLAWLVEEAKRDLLQAFST